MASGHNFVLSADTIRLTCLLEQRLDALSLIHQCELGVLLIHINFNVLMNAHFGSLGLLDGCLGGNLLSIAAYILATALIDGGEGTLALAFV